MIWWHTANGLLLILGVPKVTPFKQSLTHNEEERGKGDKPVLPASDSNVLIGVMDKAKRL